MKTDLLNLRMRIGTDVRIVLRLKNQGTPVNLTGFQASLRCGNGLALDTGSMGGITLGGAAGTITISVPKERTRTIPLGGLTAGSQILYRRADGGAVIATGLLDAFQLDMTDPAGQVHGFLSGTVVFTPEV